MNARGIALTVALWVAGGIAAAAVPSEFSECPDCPQMVAIPAGKFLMGSPAREPGRFDSEGPQHVATVRAFALGKYPVTSEQFLIFLRATGYQPKPCNALLGLGWHQGPRGLAYAPSDNEPPRWPAVCLGHGDALAYIAWLNAQAKAAHPTLTGAPYRLPSETEWEYAARAGTTSARWWGEEIGGGHANCNGCGSPWDDRVLGAVDSFDLNGFGLAGMLGNAWQWTADCWHPSYAGAPADGSAWTEPGCKKYVLRGGAWNNVPIFIRSAARNAGTDAGAEGGDYDYSSLAGFRVARSLP